MKSQFKETLRRPAKSAGDNSWGFVLLPKDVSAILPRRGRATVNGTLNGHAFVATLEPDGQLSHWLRVSMSLMRAAKVGIGEQVTVEIEPMDQEPEPDIPSDLQEALSSAPEAKAIWLATTTIARLDWVHWIESAKQTKTRKKRISNACDMLASGKKRVCCFDQSGYYSKALSAPKEAD